MSDAILELQHLSKRYGDYLAVDDLSMVVPQGAVYGLLGPNGAGKTTTIRMIMRIIAPDLGEVLLDGGPVDENRRRLIGYLPEERGLYRKMKVLEHLVYLGTIRGVSPGESRKRASGWRERLELADWATHKVEDLSKGMQQKVQFCGAIVGQPELLVLDEPTDGIDPLGRAEVRRILLEGLLDAYFVPSLGAGLVVASGAAAGLELLAFKHAFFPGAAVVPAANAAALQFFAAHGAEEASRAPRMALGDPLAWQPEQVFARGTGYCG